MKYVKTYVILVIFKSYHQVCLALFILKEKKNIINTQVKVTLVSDSDPISARNHLFK